MNLDKVDGPLAGGPRYEALKELGRGGMGVVYLALAKGPKGFSKLVVLKMMRRDMVGEAEAHRMFLQEARISARLTHPNIVQVHEICEHDGVPTMVMEYLEGKPLSAVLRGDGVPAPRSLLLFTLTKVLAGLHAAHDLRDYDGSPLNLVHRDISPHNVFVLFDGQIKVLDFGIAKAAGSEVETRTGATKGKIRYMSPEQFLHLPADRRDDVFTVGVTLWEILAGKRFWGDASDDEVISRLVARRLPALPPDPAVPADLAAICGRAIAAEREERYATAGRFQRDLEEHLVRQAERVTADDVAVFMHYRFDVEQDSAKSVLESHLRSSQQAVAAAQQEQTRVVTRRSGLAQGTPPAHAKQVARSAAPAPPEPSAGAQASVADVPVAAPARVKTRALLLAIGAVVLLVAGVAGGVMTGRARGGSAFHGGPPSASTASAAEKTCARGFKQCDGTCLSIDRPDRGCGDQSCYACNVSNATPRCNRSHGCDIAVCHPGFEDCNGDSRDGCETNVRVDPDNCGGCGQKCASLAHAQRGCGDTCTIWRCETGYRDCNRVVADGCEVDARGDRANCGACGHACGPGQTCRKGICE